MQNEPSPPWDDLRVLLALHRHRSFLAAGKALGVSTSTAARRIAALEAALGRPLVHRSSGGTFVEPDALELVALAEQIELGLRAIRRDEGEEALSGTVRVSTGEGAVRGVTKCLCELRRLHPGLHLEILSESRLVDLARREADIGLRSGRTSSPVVVQRAVGQSHFGLYAAPSYIERRLRGGRLKTTDFERHDFVGDERMLAKAPKIAWLVKHGAKRFVVRSNSDFGVLEAAVQGQGIVLLSDLTGRATPGLVRLEVDAELPSVPVFLAYHRELRNVPRVRLVLNALDRTLREALR
ncbi:LysR family transcriptional regulator [Chondromyces crocatus]|uniref:LysR family transcriptional regulator n=1 Tax=Chondromyces crocatus TaxID=52 RepID=A0A0K1ED21_CHOCO|nr:LysR family transcriptional regulator [Chondromyces crocatus]AKT38478.1 LysR family transcriptional regulator [Chondromyces crocatus]